MIQRYFEEEMRYLQEAGSAFAKVHPDQGRLLNIDSLTDRDPYVERLFEGFAFLTARIREQLDDEMPQYTESLFRLLHPHFVRPVPSLAIEAFTPRAGMLQETVELPAGTEVRSGPVGPNSTMCRFTTAYPVRLQPMKLQEMDLTWPTGTQSTVSMRFLLDRGIEYRQLNLSRLRLYFYAEPTKASTMHLFFTRHVRKVEVRAEGETATLLGQQWVRPVGFGPEEGLLPYSAYSFTGYRILQEYFCFRPKFWFVDLLGLDRFDPPDGTSDFEVIVHFDQAFPEAQAFRKDNLRLYCTPVVNLFEADADPIRIDHREAEHLVIPDVHRRRDVTVYDIQHVVGTEDATGRRHSYEPFFAFKHRAG